MPGPDVRPPALLCNRLTSLLPALQRAYPRRGEFDPPILVVAPGQWVDALTEACRGYDAEVMYVGNKNLVVRRPYVMIAVGSVAPVVEQSLRLVPGGLYMRFED